MSVRIVGFIGPKGAGKDAASKFLEKKEKIAHKMSFAGPLKQICSDIFGIPKEHMEILARKETKYETPIVLTKQVLKLIKNELPKYVSELDKTNNTFRYNVDRTSLTGLENREIWSLRELLQVVGTDFIRDRVYKNWHLEAAFSPKALAKLNTAKIYSVTDVRFENELQFLQTKFPKSFICYYIENPEAEERLQSATHASELEIKKLRALVSEEFIVKNDGSLEDLEKTVMKLKLPGPLPRDVFQEAKRNKFIYGKK
jgi:uncharacterized tellurite resistance protein B-like protein